VALYLIACVLTLNLPARQTPLNKAKATMDSLLAGIRFIRSRPDILGAISLDMFAVLLGGATALLPVFAKDILLTGAWGLGFGHGRILFRHLLPNALFGSIVFSMSDAVLVLLNGAAVSY
ncbi:hypothetical protein KQI01_03250, partial [Vibrio cholerae]|nr:hypothetical protein [Vibrio cholerae]